MAMSSSGKERVLWYLNTGDSVHFNWIPFPDIENEILEENYSKKGKKLQLDEYLIDLDKCVQIDGKDNSVQRSIKRSTDQMDETPLLRSERFSTPQKLVRSFSENNPNDRRFVNEWKRQHTKMSTDEKLESAAIGIRKEGVFLGRSIEGEWMSQQLRSVKSQTNEEIQRCVISLYTLESFLYQLVNRTLRENDQSKLDTLGAFCQLLFSCDCSPIDGKSGYAGEVYRGAQLDEETIDSYKQSLGQMKTWDAFSSTSKNRRKAECFGNVLFIINRCPTSRFKYSGMDISALSHYPEEEEVLLRAARNFLVEKVEKDNLTGKYSIYLLLS